MISNIPSSDGIDQDPQQNTYLPSPEQAKQLYDMGQLDGDTARKLGAKIDPAFIEAVIDAESNRNPNAVSPKGAQGLMQVMPPTGAEVARQLGMEKYDLKNPDDNRAIGTEYLSQQMQKYDNPMLAAAAYNAGPGAVDEAIQKAGTNDASAVLQFLPKETQNYVPKVMAGYQQRAQGSQPPSESTYATNPSVPSAQVLGVVSNVGSPDGTSPDPYTMKSEAVEAISNVGIQKAREEASFMRERVVQHELMMVEQQKKEAQRQDEIKAQEQKAEQAREDFLTAKIDPGRFWNNKTTGDKIIAIIAVGLGAFGAGLNKSDRNRAMENINSQIERDIEAQKQDILNKKDSVTQATGMLSQLRSKFDDQRTAEKLAQVIGLDHVKLKLEEIASKSKSSEVAANRDLLLAQIEEDRGNKMIEVQKAIAEASMKRFDRNNKIDDSPEERRRRRNLVMRGEGTPEDLHEKDRERFVPGLGMAITADDAKKIKEGSESFEALDSILLEMINLRKEYGGETFNTSVAKKQKLLAAQAILKIKNTADLGALDIGAITIADRIVPKDPSARSLSLSGGGIPQLEEAREQFRKDFNSKMRARLSEPMSSVKEELKKTGSTSSFTPKQ